MLKVVGVRFRTAGKVYYFNPLNFDIKKGSHVIVETARGIEYGTVVCNVMEMDESKIVQPLKPVLRIATEKDDEQQQNNREKEKEAFKICLAKIQEHGLVMKLIDAEYTFDNNKVLFYFTADGRVDFRELVKDLASVFRTRIELRQIGSRDETKMLGGFGVCGRPVCCHTYLSDFNNITIKMAKEQGLSLNPGKISGVCGRLMCCLQNEYETYEYLNKQLPNIGDFVTTPDGTKGVVHSVNVLRQKVQVTITKGDEKEIQEYPAEELQYKKHGYKEREIVPEQLSEEDMKELEAMEKQDIADQENSNEKPKYQNRRERGISKHENDNREGDKKFENKHDDKFEHKGDGKKNFNHKDNYKGPKNFHNHDRKSGYQRNQDRGGRNGGNRPEGNGEN